MELMNQFRSRKDYGGIFRCLFLIKRGQSADLREQGVEEQLEEVNVGHLLFDAQQGLQEERQTTGDVERIDRPFVGADEARQYFGCHLLQR